MQDFYANEQFQPSAEDVKFVFEHVESYATSMRFRVYKLKCGRNGSSQLLEEFTFPYRSASRARVSAFYKAMVDADKQDQAQAEFEELFYRNA